MKLTKDNTSTYILIGLAILVVFAYAGGYLSGENVAGSNVNVQYQQIPIGVVDSTTTTTTTDATTTTQPTAESPLELDSKFVSVAGTNSTGTAVTFSNLASSNFDEDTYIASIQVDAESSYDATGDGNTTFTILARDIDGTTWTIGNITEAGTIKTVPTAALVSTVLTATVTEDMIGGFINSQQVKYATISASASVLKDTDGTTFSPVVTKATATLVPEIKVNGNVDFQKYTWTSATTTVTIPITFNFDWEAIDKMDEISDKVTVTGIYEGADDTPLKLEIIRNEAI